MSLSTLPPELRLRIAQHLRDSIGDDKDSMRKQGLHLSLISRQWRELGTRMSWEKFTLVYFHRDSIQSGIAHVHNHPELARLVKDVTISLEMEEEHDRDVPPMMDSIEDRWATDQFAIQGFPSFTGLESLDMSFNTEDLAQDFLFLFRDEEENPFPRLRDFSFSFDDTEHEQDTSSREYDEPGPCPTLFEILPILSDLRSLSIRLYLKPSSTLPKTSLVPTAFSSLTRLSIDLTHSPDAEDDESVDSQETNEEEETIEHEKYPIYLLSLPSPTVLRSLSLSIAVFSSLTLTVVESFTSLTSLTLQLLSEILDKNLVSLFPSFTNLNQLRCLKLLASYDYKQGKLVYLDRNRLEQFLASLPISLESLVTHFDLGDSFPRPLLLPTVDSFLDSRMISPLKSWMYYDEQVERETLGVRTECRTAGDGYQRISTSKRSDRSTQIDGRVTTVTHRTERSLVAREDSKAIGTQLFEIFVDPEKPGSAVCFIYLFALDVEKLRVKFLSAGRNLEQLDQADQISCRLVWVSAAKRSEVISPAQPQASVRTTQLLKKAQATADSLSIWGDPDARHYLLAAANHFRHLFRKPSDLKEANGKPVWIAHRFAILDCQVALENGTEPALSARDHLIFSPSSVSDSFHLPSPAMLQDYTSDSTPAYVMVSQYAIRYFFLVAHSLATQFSFPDHANVEMIQWAWEKLDVYDSWIQATLSVFRSLEMSVSLQALALSTMMWMYSLYHVLESAILDHLRSTLETLALEDELLTDSTAFETMSKFALLFAESMTRYEGCVCRLVRTTRNPDSVVQLTGFASSTRRLNTLATTFCASSVSDETLFPLGRLDKLASAA
ncbi:hypothetical protein JCM3765_000239 [Sporobolomyces pararoseus]